MKKAIALTIMIMATSIYAMDKREFIDGCNEIVDTTFDNVIHRNFYENAISYQAYILGKYEGHKMMMVIAYTSTNNYVTVAIGVGDKINALTADNITTWDYLTFFMACMEACENGTLYDYKHDENVIMMALNNY